MDDIQGLYYQLAAAVAFCCEATFAASLRAASWSRSVSTASSGTCTYRTTLPRIKQFFTDSYRFRVRLLWCDGLSWYHVWVALDILDLYVCELHVEVLVDGLEGAGDDHVILQLDMDGLAHQCFEEAVEYLATIRDVHLCSVTGVPLPREEADWLLGSAPVKFGYVSATD